MTDLILQDPWDELPELGQSIFELVNAFEFRHGCSVMEVTLIHVTSGEDKP